ncbi:organic solvent tolerance protein [Arcobacter sp. CECT 8983]|uniref:LPS-assembly protein LptD n=1 Tax=Arcobacter sp. CECT 8983 TaxID=2044508 RepID=UPI00100B597F|nr:LPS-assembly protein LptD [Arcobacter sp. CECT 8983]RXJ89246.1 organic solvent tolerance protein [Arcobacter sp. CECT 8983]
MLKKVLATAILVVSLHAESEKFQVIANNLNTKNNILVAKGDVVVFSPKYYITAQKIIHDKDKNTLELFDDVIIVKNNNVQTKSDYAFLDLNKDDLYQKPNIFYEEKSQIWINSKEADKKNDLIELGKSILSSCDCVDPDWSIRSSSMDYDTKDMWINTYNTTLYVKDFPVIYTPYLGFSTDTRRRTGLLIPLLGYSTEEGFFYNQPIYFAPAPNYDIEVVPQIRTNRGYGSYFYFRYADSPDSMLKIGTGYFKEKDSYVEKNDLRDDEHYGFNLDYKRVNLFADTFDSKDGLYASIRYLNNVEFNSLEDSRYQESIERKVESKINYIYNTPNYFLGAYSRYYIDTQKESNNETLQELPKLQAHSYSRPLIDKLMYSTDLKYTNHYRRDGLNANQYEFSIPLSYSFSLFDDYLTLTLKHQITANKFSYDDKDINLDLEDGTFVESVSSIVLNSDLIKAYENYIHTMNLSAEYNHFNTMKKDGDLFSISNNNSQLSSFPVSESTDNVVFGLNQSIYDKENLKQIINHRIRQSFEKDENDNFELGNLENQLTYNYALGSISNKVVYNHEDDQFIENSTSFSLSYEDYYLRLGYYMSKDTPNSGKEELESYNVSTNYRISNDYKIGYTTTYDLERDYRSKEAIHFDINDRCWDFSISFERETEPASTIDSEPITQDIFYLQLVLKPLGAVKQEFELERDN